ncbi:MAG TPA: PLP-dependent aminotransferase family protein [Pyrinomonadaceae bacterium]|nr:PLP-dependent aminotransferase family protein [Pyrinomonadaceae bacterium]
MLETPAPATDKIAVASWARSIRRSALQDMLAMAARPNILSFALGLPASELFPVEQYSEAAAHVLATDRRALQYQPPHAALKRHVVALMRQRGVLCDERQVFLTAGAQQGMNLLARVLLNQRGLVLMEDLAYTGFQQVVAPYQPEVLTVPTDTETGIDVDAVESLLRSGARPALIYIVTDGHNPLGVSMAKEKRIHLVRLARRFRVPIVEDDAYGLLHYEGASLKPLRAFDGEWVCYVGSFSKILAPALRVGWLVVPESLLDALSVVKESTDINTSTFAQRTVAAFLDAGHLPAHLSMLRREYRARRDAMNRALGEHFPAEARWTLPENGLFIWVTLPEGMDAGELMQRAVEQEEVAFIPGHAFSVKDPQRGANCMRLNFSNCDAARIEDGVRRLGRVLKSAMPQAAASAAP